MNRSRIKYSLMVMVAILLFLNSLVASTPQFYNITQLGEDKYRPVYSLAQDRDGYMWLGTDIGLYRYDGYRFVKYDIDTSALPHNRINTLYYDESQNGLYIGTDAGAAYFNLEDQSVEPIESCGRRVVKTFSRGKKGVVAGTSTGVVYIDGDNATLYDNLDAHSSHVASSLAMGDNLLFGGYNQLYEFKDGKYNRAIELPYQDRLKDNLVLEIVKDIESDDAIWLGTEQGLIHYNLKSHKSELYLDHTPTKELFYTADSTLWIGGDNGLYRRDKLGQITHFRHNVENMQSLPNDVVWSIFSDMNGMMWVGSDAGVSMTNIEKEYKQITTYQLTGKNSGFNVKSIAIDSRQSLWLGGNNGLIKVPKDELQSEWYTTSDNSIAHNKVNDIYPDHHSVWLATDGGVGRYSYQRDAFDRFKLPAQSANWVYCINRHNSEDIWVGTYDGIYIVKDEDFTHSKKITTHTTFNILFYGDFAYMLTPTGLFTIDVENYSLQYIDTPDGVVVNSIFGDDNRLWVSTNRGVYYSDNGKHLEFLEGTTNSVKMSTVQNGYLWAITDNEVIGWNKKSMEWDRYITIDEMTPFYCYAHNSKLLIGSTGGILELLTNTAPHTQSRVQSKSAEITYITLSGELHPISDVEQITLPYNNNSFAIEFSSFDFNAQTAQYAYRLNGLNKEWQYTGKGGNSATFINVPAGRYTFQVTTLDYNGEINEAVQSFLIIVEPAWYISTTAIIVYVVFILVLLVWVVHYFRVRHLYKIEQFERAKTLEMIDMKSDFFANLSHEFKTPLSIVLGHLSKMISTESSAIRTKDLELARNSAEKMHLLINKMLKYNNNSGIDLFIPTATDLNELVGQAFDRFQIAFEQKSINARLFSSDIDYIFMLDRTKIESVLDNLISNAIKFTPSGGHIVISLDIVEQTADMLWAEIKVKDSGCGVTQDELPLLFNKYYKAPSNQAMNSVGTGIGLDLVRQIIEQHKGSISAQSIQGEGSTFTIKLSTLKANSFVINTQEEHPLTLHNLSQVWGHKRKPIILLVDDNRDIRDFIIASLGDDYIFLSAENGKQALKLLESEKIDLVITDLSMPEMDGLQMSKRIRANIKSAFLPILVLTGADNPNLETESLEYVDLFIAKPFNLNFLSNAIVSLLIKHEHYLQKIKEQHIVTPQRESIVNSNEVFLSTITDIVTKHINDFDFTAAKLCEQSPYGAKQVYRKMKELTGMSIVEFIRDMRLQKAALLLSENDLNISEVMYMVGFSSNSYFTKCFKEKFKVTPSEYQNINR